MSLRKNQTGFSAIEVILLVLIVAIIGGATTYVIFRQLDTTDNTQVSETSDKKENAAPAEPEAVTQSRISGVPIMSTDNKAEFILPTDWSVISRNNDSSTCEFTGGLHGDCVLDTTYKPNSLTTNGKVLWNAKIFKTTDTPQSWYSKNFSECVGYETTNDQGYKNIKCNTDYVLSNGNYIALFITHDDVVLTAPYADRVSQIANSIRFK